VVKINEFELFDDSNEINNKLLDLKK